MRGARFAFIPQTHATTEKISLEPLGLSLKNGDRMFHSVRGDGTPHRHKEVDMNSHSVANRFMRIIIASVVSLVFVATALAASTPAIRTTTIIVFADRYVVGYAAFDDIGFLERYITETDARGVELIICGAKATRALKAAVHRFRHMPMTMLVADVDEAECMSKVPVVTPASQRVGERPFGIDDEAVESYWLDITP
jgi:hypothetical protein